MKLASFHVCTGQLDLLFYEISGPVFCSFFCWVAFDWFVLVLVLSHFSRVRPHRRQPTRLCHPWDSPGKNTGVGWHFLLQCRKVKSESEVAQLCQTRSDPMDCSLPGSSVHGIFQARVLEWGAIAFSVLPTSKSLTTLRFHFFTRRILMKILSSQGSSGD